MSKFYYLLDAGHGGMKDGVYTTAPKKMFKFEDGFTIYEGVITRKISTELQRLLCIEKISHALVYDEVEDTPLSKRSGIVNLVYDKKPNTVVLSIHANAGGGKGIEVFTGPGKTHSDPFGDIFAKKAVELLPQFKFRPDWKEGDLAKDEAFHMVGYEKDGKWRGPKCPAILVECLFFDNRDEAEYLSSEAGQKEIANWLFESIKQCEKSL